MRPQSDTSATVRSLLPNSSDAPKPPIPTGQQPFMRIPPPRGLPVELQTLDQLQQSAMDGDLDACSMLGSIYLHGSEIVRPGVIKDDAKAIEWWSRAASQGNALSQNNLGMSHLLGRGGLEKDEHRAVEWFTKAANQGDVGGQYNLGVACATGVGIGVDQPRAVKLLTRSAEQGYALAQHRLGMDYATGCRLPRSDAKAFRYHQMAAHQGDVASQGIVGFMLETGVRISRDIVKAVEWYEKAGTAGNANAKCRMARLYATGLGVVKDEAKSARLYGEAAVQGDAEALYQSALLSCKSANGNHRDSSAFREWKLASAFDGWTKAAAQGHPDALYELGNLYGSGICTARDPKQAFVRYVDAAERGHLHAHYKVSAMYATGSGVERDAAKAAQWWNKAAPRDDPDVLFERLSTCMETTSAVDRSMNFARLAQAAGNGLSEAQFFIGMAYELGIDFTADSAKAVEYFEKAARQGHPSAQYRLGKIHLQGSAATSDIGEAFRLFNAAAQQGHREAQCQLAMLYWDPKSRIKDGARGMAWLHKAARQGSLNAQSMLSHYLYRVGIERDEAGVVPHIESLAMNNVEFQYELGNRYASGRGVARDDAKAELWWRRAAVRGHTLAQGCLSCRAT